MTRTIPEIAAERKFLALVADLSDGGEIENSARVNAQDTAKDEGFEIGSVAFWKVAINTAEMLIDMKG